MMYIDAIEIVTGIDLILVATRTKLREIIDQDIIFSIHKVELKPWKREPFMPLLCSLGNQSSHDYGGSPATTNVSI